MMSSEVKKMTEMIDQKIKSLRYLKDLLLTEFGNNKLQPTLPLNSISTRATKKHLTKKDAIIELLQTEGALSRKDITEKTGFKKGTIAFTLHDKTIFVNKNGRWDLAERKVNQ